MTENPLEEETEKSELELEKQAKLEEARMKLKAILFCALPVLVGFLTFFYFFLNSLVEK